jgi:conjugal transfer pilus assembly protein TraE
LVAAQLDRDPSSSDTAIALSILSGLTMKFSKFTAERDNQRNEILFMRIAVGGLVLALLANAGASLTVAGSERTILVPPEIHQSFWVSGQKVSGEYLQEMAYWYAGLALNITPHVADYQKNQFLKYAAPSDYGRLQAEFGARGTSSARTTPRPSSPRRP